MAGPAAAITNLVARLGDSIRGVADINSTAAYERLWNSARRARIPFDKEAWLNYAFYNNEQYVEWVPSAMTLQEIPKPRNAPELPRPVANKIMHFVEQEHSMVLQTRPNIDVLPASSDPTDISMANVAGSFLDWAMDETVANMNQEVAIATKWALAASEGFLKWFWSPKKDRVDVMACGPFEIYCDPYARKFSDCRYIIHSQFMDVEQVYDIYGKEVQPSSPASQDPGRLAVMHDLGFAPVLDGALVHELWMKPSRRYPDGLYVVWTAHDVLFGPTAFPYEHKQLPFTQIGSILKPGTTHYACAVSYLRSPQMELNKFHAQMIQVRQNYANPKWWLPTDLELESDPDDSPNQILRGNSQGGILRPEIIQPAAMPPNDQGAWITSEMEDVVGLHEVSQAQVPGRVEAAKAIELLKEADDGRLAELLRTIETSLSLGGYQWLMLARQFMTAEQMVITYSRDGMPETSKFFAEKLAPGIKVRVLMGTGLSRSRAAREDTLMLMWDNGIIQDKAVMAELMDVPISSVAPDDDYDLRLAQNENYVMAQGTPIIPNSWDNHDIHRTQHNNYRKTQEFLALDMDDKVIFEAHVQMHDQQEIQSLGAQLQRQSLAAQVAQGAGFAQPAEPGAPTEPSTTPTGAATPPTATPVGSQGNQMPGSSVPVPNAMGAATPVDPYAVRDSPQGQVSYQDRYASDLVSGKQVMLNAPTPAAKK